MGKTFFKLFGFSRLLLSTIKIACIFILLEGCYCEQRCRFKANPGDGFSLMGTRVASNDPRYDCFEYCSIINIDPDRWARDPFAQNNQSTSINPIGDSVASVSSTTSIPQKKSPGHPIPGEYFATTITAGPSLSFKSSDEEYGGGYGDHKPGVGLHVAVGTLFPFTPRWALATSLRFTQKNASEEMGYTEPGGGGGMEFKDNYSYNYLGVTMMAQFRVSRHLSLVAGPEVNYLLSAKVKNGGSSGTGEKQSLNESSQKVGVDGLAGVKYEIPSSNGRRSKWGLSLIYDHRFSRLNKKEDNGVAVPAYHMKSINLGLSYFICGKCGAPKKPSGK